MNEKKALQIIREGDWQRIKRIAEYELSLRTTTLTEFFNY